MSHDFSKIPAANVPRSVFKRPYECHTAHNAGDLIPVYVEEVYPADTHKFNGRIFSRLTTPLTPFMSNLYLDSFFFYVPYRLIHDNFEKMMGAQDNPADSISYLTPKMYLPASTGWVQESLQDYLNYGEPAVAGDGTSTYAVHNYAGRAYNLIWNTFFRDENIQDSVVVDTDDGPDTVGDYVIKKRGKRHDYFTSCLPWPQKGTAVPLLVSGSAPVYGQSLSDAGVAGFGYVAGTHLWQGEYSDTTAGQIHTGAIEAIGTDPHEVSTDYAAAGGSGATAYPQNWSTAGSGSAAFGMSLATEAQYTAKNSAFGSSYNTAMFKPPLADLSAVEAGNINDFRTAFQIQMLLEQDARGGTRYVELLKSHFGVISPDFRLQNPEYLGGGRTNLNMMTIPQTSETNTTSQGTLAAYAQFAGGKHGFSKSFVEHGIIIGMVSVRSDYSYQRGIPRYYSRDSRYDFYWPAFAHLGEQAVLNKEIYMQGLAGGTADEGVFGYQEAWADLRYARSITTGKMRSSATGTLDIWHLAQKFTSLPTLDDTFIQENPPIDRVVEVSTEPDFKTDVYADITSVRAMPVYSVPGLITRL